MASARMAAWTGASSIEFPSENPRRGDLDLQLFVNLVHVDRGSRSRRETAIRIEGYPFDGDAPRRPFDPLDHLVDGIDLARGPVSRQDRYSISWNDPLP